MGFRIWSRVAVRQKQFGSQPRLVAVDNCLSPRLRRSSQIALNIVKNTFVTLLYFPVFSRGRNSHSGTVKSMANRTTGLDFSDKKSPMDALAAHPDVLARAPTTSNLQRNKTERHRLQGLMRSMSNPNTSESDVKVPNKMKDEKLMDRWHTWLINGGQSKLIFGIYIFLHLIVITLGFLNYQLKDNQTIIRSIVGPGFG